MSKTKVLPAVVTLGNAQQQVFVKPVRTKHRALRAKVTLAEPITVVPGKAH